MATNYDKSKTYRTDTEILLNEIVKMQFKTGCAEIIYIDDNLSEKQMANIYKSCKFIVHPYRAEGFGMHIQEAVACGCYPILPAVGPHTEFIPDNVGLRVATTKNMIDMQNPEIFALKPGDATTLMSTHTFAEEPSREALQAQMQNIYHHHEKDKLIDEIKEVKLENTWDNIANKYEEVILNVGEHLQPQRVS